jgi:tRNA-guanine family transglycosylase
MDIQRSIGADIIMAFDECTPYPCDYDYAQKSMQLTHRWLARCVKHKNASEPLYGYNQSLFPIVQGSTYKDLRIQSAEFAASMECDGNAIGGLSVGEPAEKMYEMSELVCSILPKDKPRYLMGVGTPANILENIALGIDMFDCVCLHAMGAMACCLQPMVSSILKTKNGKMILVASMMDWIVLPVKIIAKPIYGIYLQSMNYLDFNWQVSKILHFIYT